MNSNGDAAIRKAYATAVAPDLDVEATLAGLATLEPIPYDLARKRVAEDLGVRIETLDSEVAKRRPRPADFEADVTGSSLDEAWHDEPWPNPVDTAGLLDELRELFARHVVLPSHGPETLALWTLHAWANDAALTSPLLAFISPEKRCGKTKALELLAYVVPKPASTSNITPAALFRVVEKWHPTVIIDECDTFLGENPELGGLLNSGHTRSAAWAIRTVGDDHEPRRFSTWAPKVVAAIGRLRDTLMDRSIEISMARKRPGERVDRMRADRLEAFQLIRRRAARWAIDAADVLRTMDAEAPEDLNDRAADSWRPLLAIADHAGTSWSMLARAAASALSGAGASGAEESVKITLLEDIRDAFADLGPRVSSGDLVARLTAMEDRPWPEWMKGKPLSVRQLARLLKPFGIQPKTVRIGSSTPKGYDEDDFLESFARYVRSATATQPAPDAGFHDSSSATPPSHVADEKAQKVLSQAVCGGVADRNTPERPPTEVRMY